MGNKLPMKKRNEGRCIDTSQIQMSFPHLVKGIHHQYDKDRKMCWHYMMRRKSDMSTLWFTGFWWNSMIGWGNLGNTMWWQLKLFLVINKKEIKKDEKTSDALKCFFQTFYLPALLFSKTVFSIASLSWSWFLVAGVKKNSNELSFRERGGKKKRNVSKFPFWGSQGAGPLLLSLE